MDGSSTKETMANELYRAAMSGDSEFIENTSLDDEYLCRKTFVANNMLHIAIRYGNTSFVRKALLRVPHLMWEPNNDGNSPLHVAAERGNTELVSDICEELMDPSPLRMKNSMGNTPLHVALIHNKYQVAKMLVEKDPELAIIVNDLAEAPLHLVIKHFVGNDNDFYDDDWVKDTFGSINLLETKRTNSGEDYGVILDTVLVIAILLEEAGHVACWRDASGMTPLHRAASLHKSINLYVIALMIEYCPQCMEVCDSFGNTILHHLVNRIMYSSDGKELLIVTGMHGLKDHQNKDGNAPLHLASIHSDIIMVVLLSSSCFKANWDLKNKEGLSANTLSDQSDEMNQILKGKAATMMADETCHLIERGELFSIKDHVDRIGIRFYKLVDSKGRNIVHKLLLLLQWGRIIIPKELLGFIKPVISGFPELLEQADSNGDTPIHVLAQLDLDNIMIHLGIDDENSDNPKKPENLYPGPQPEDSIYFSSNYLNLTYVWENLVKTKFFTDLIELCLSSIENNCLAKNVKGNTALHEAILANNYPVFDYLAQRCEEATTQDNKLNETILHLLATHPMPAISDTLLSDIIKSITKKNRTLLDEDGLTPVMRAIRAGNIGFAERLIFLCPSLAKLVGTNDQTFWHELVNEPPIETFNLKNSPFTKEGVLSLLNKKDKDGKTALHLAVERRRFDLAEAFLGLHGGVTPKGTPIFQRHLLKIQNNEGVTPAELIGELTYVPFQFEEFFGKSSTMIGIRSIWGIPSTQIKDYVNALGVIAALLTTITFTAAFAVPGGLDQEKGTPLLIQDASFQIFMISDIIAMCLSMMVLFCLLWIMASGNKSNAVVLLDFSIILLMASFYATLVTFMTGLYATTYLVKPWIAIVGLVMCTLLLLLMHKYLVMKIIIPTGKFVLIYFDKAIHNARKLRKKLLRRIKNHGHPRRSPTSELPISSIEAHNSTKSG